MSDKNIEGNNVSFDIAFLKAIISILPAGEEEKFNLWCDAMGACSLVGILLAVPIPEHQVVWVASGGFLSLLGFNAWCRKDCNKNRYRTYHLTK